MRKSCNSKGLFIMKVKRERIQDMTNPAVQGKRSKFHSRENLIVNWIKPAIEGSRYLEILPLGQIAHQSEIVRLSFKMSDLTNCLPVLNCLSKRKIQKMITNCNN